MTQQEIDKIIKKYLQGEATQEEINHIENFEQFAKNKIKDKVFRNKIEKREVKNTILKNIQKNVLRRPKNRTWLKAAASVAILITIGVGYYFSSLDAITVKATKITYITKETSWGKKLDVTLPDGSMVKMNSGSKLIFPEKFTDSIRSVVLEGEAYFDVIENPNKPFVIVSDKITTTVLGTTFNVEAYSDESDIRVTLKTGKVSIDSNNENTILIPSRQAVFNKDENTIKTQRVDVQKYLDWKDGVLRFENVTLGEAAKKLEKWYNVTVAFENKELGECTFTGTFKNEKLETVLESLIFVKQHLNYDFISKNKIMLKGRCTN